MQKELFFGQTKNGKLQVVHNQVKKIVEKIQNQDYNILKTN